MKSKVTIYWEDDFIAKAKAYAKSKGISLSKLVEEAIKAESYKEKNNEK
jgi:post-segregation antitoxin (ccd killing protein)